MTRAIRLIRLIRIVKLYKSANQAKERREEAQKKNLSMEEKLVHDLKMEKKKSEKAIYHKIII